MRRNWEERVEVSVGKKEKDREREREEGSHSFHPIAILVLPVPAGAFFQANTLTKFTAFLTEYKIIILCYILGNEREGEGGPFNYINFVKQEKRRCNSQGSLVTFFDEKF